MQIKAIRGTRDLLPPETALWNFIEQKVRDVFGRYNFHEIRTPIFEHTELFARSVGQETDIVSKEMYTWLDRGRIDDGRSGDSLTLRPENTAGVVRAYIENRLDRTGLVHKLFYIGPQFRRERPQKGRHRQFYQIGAEVIGPVSAGSESPIRDAEVIEMAATLLNELSVRDWTLKLNSVGCPADRQRYVQALRVALEPVKHQLCADCKRRAETNPLRVLDCKVPEDQAIINNLPRLRDYLDKDCAQHFDNLKAILDELKVPYEQDDRLVRGLDYYTRTAFEFIHGSLGAQNSLIGGGRYDGLSESLGGSRAPGIGFALGEDRLVLIVREKLNVPLPRPDVFVAPEGEGMNRRGAVIAKFLRDEGLLVELGNRNWRMKKSLETAGKLSCRFALLVRAEHVQSKLYPLKDLDSGTQESKRIEDIPSYVRTARLKSDLRAGLEKSFADIRRSLEQWKQIKAPGSEMDELYRSYFTRILHYSHPDVKPSNILLPEEDIGWYFWSVRNTAAHNVLPEYPTYLSGLLLYLYLFGPWKGEGKVREHWLSTFDEASGPS